MRLHHGPLFARGKGDGTMRKLFMLGTVVLLLVQTSAAQAQITGSRIGGTAVDVPDNLDMKPVDRARYTMVKMGECMVKQNKGRVLNYLRTLPYSEAAAKNAQALLNQDSCLSSGDITTPESTLRGALYTGLYRQEFKLRGPGDIANAPKIDYASGHSVAQLGATGLQAIALRNLGDCLVRADPAAAHEMIASEVLSAKQNAAFSRLATKLSGCIGRGVSIKLNRLGLQGLVAENLYRLALSASGKPDTASRT